MIIAQIVTVAAAAIAMQAVLPAIWSGFQIVGDDPSITTLSGAANAILLGLIVLVVTTLINSVAVKVMAVVNAVGVTAELDRRHLADHRVVLHRPARARASC